MSDVYRSSDFVFRSAEGEAGVIEGRMVPYDVWAKIDSRVEGRFYERFRPGSLAKTLTERGSRLRVLFDHGIDRTVGNMPIAQVEDLRDEQDGPWYRASLLAGLPEFFMDGLRRGLYGASVRFKDVPGKTEINRKPGKSDYNPDGWEERSYGEAMLKEFSVVTFPTYEGATAVMRSVTDDLLVKQALLHPELLLEHLRKQEEEAEPNHSEPTSEADEAEEDTGSRVTQPKPRKDWLSTEEETPAWHIP